MSGLWHHGPFGRKEFKIMPNEQWFHGLDLATRSSAV
jgi:hypothetical protein